MKLVSNQISAYCFNQTSNVMLHPEELFSVCPSDWTDYATVSVVREHYFSFS